MDDAEAQNHTMTIVLDLHNDHRALCSKQVTFPIHVYFTPKWNKTLVLYILSL